MSSFKTFLKAGHTPTLVASFLYFAFSCCIWVLNGAMAPFITEDLKLSPAQKGLMLSVPIFAGAFMRFPLGILAQYIGRKSATLVGAAASEKRFEHPRRGGGTGHRRDLPLRRTGLR